MIAVACNLVKSFHLMKQPCRRRVELDAREGLMLVWMTLTHLPTISAPTSISLSDSCQARRVTSFRVTCWPNLLCWRAARRSVNGPPVWDAYPAALLLPCRALLAPGFLVIAQTARCRRSARAAQPTRFLLCAPRHAIIDSVFADIQANGLLDILPSTSHFCCSHHWP